LKTRRERQDFMEGFRKRGSKARIYKRSTLTENLKGIENRYRSRKKGWMQE